MCRKFLEMNLQEQEDMQITKDAKKYNDDGSIKPQEPDALTSTKAKSARIFKQFRDKVAKDPVYVEMRKH